MDNPNKKKADAKRVSKQPLEQAYQRRKKNAKKSAAKAKTGLFFFELLFSHRCFACA